MLKRLNEPLNSELFEELNDQFSEKVTGGNNNFEGSLFPIGVFPFDITILDLLNTDLRNKIQDQIRISFPSGFESTAALACATNEQGELVCEVSADGQEAKTFAVPVQ